jgi:hypothetical protein
MDEWVEVGNQLLLMGDWDGDIPESGLTDFFANYEMHQALIDRHGESAPATCNMGSSPIDGAWVTSSLDIALSSYFNFEEGLPGNHRTLWLAITYVQGLGHSQPAIIQHSDWRLKLDDLQCTCCLPLGLGQTDTILQVNVICQPAGVDSTRICF